MQGIQLYRQKCIVHDLQVSQVVPKNLNYEDASVVNGELRVECVTAIGGVKCDYNCYTIAKWAPVNFSDMTGFGVKLWCTNEQIVFVMGSLAAQLVMRTILLTGTLVEVRHQIKRQGGDMSNIELFRDLVELSARFRYRQVYKHDPTELTDGWRIYSAGEQEEYCAVCFSGDSATGFLYQAEI